MLTNNVLAMIHEYVFLQYELRIAEDKKNFIFNHNPTRPMKEFSSVSEVEEYDIERKSYNFALEKATNEYLNKYAELETLNKTIAKSLATNESFDYVIWHLGARLIFSWKKHQGNFSLERKHE